MEFEAFLRVALLVFVPAIAAVLAERWVSRRSKKLWLGLATLFGTLFVLIISGALLLQSLGMLVEPERNLSDRVEAAYKSMLEASKLVDTLQVELTDRLAKVEQLRKDYDTYLQLATLEEAKAKALIRQLEVSLGRTHRWDWLVSLAINLVTGAIFFILGVALGPWLQRRWHKSPGTAPTV